MFFKGFDLVGWHPDALCSMLHLNDCLLKLSLGKSCLLANIRKIKKPYCKDICFKTSSAVRLSLWTKCRDARFCVSTKTLYFASPDRSGFAFIVMCFIREFLFLLSCSSFYVKQKNLIPEFFTLLRQPSIIFCFYFTRPRHLSLSPHL